MSPEDRYSRIEIKIDEYFAFGVPNVWIIDPEQRKAWSYTKDGRREITSRLSTADPDLSLQLSDIFAELDDCVERE